MRCSALYVFLRSERRRCFSCGGFKVHLRIGETKNLLLQGRSSGSGERRKNRKRTRQDEHLLVFFLSFHMCMCGERGGRKDRADADKKKKSRVKEVGGKKKMCWGGGGIYSCRFLPLSQNFFPSANIPLRK